MMMISTAFAVTESGVTKARGLRPAILGLALLASFAVATQASAWSYTLDAPITIDASNNNGSGVFGTINQVSGHFTMPTPTGNAVGTVLDNSTDKTLQDFVWFSVTLDAGSVALDQLTISIVPLNFADPEYFDGVPPFVNNPIGASYSTLNGGVAPNDDGGPNVRAPVQIGLGLGDFAEFNWDFGDGTPANHLQGGDTSADLLWVGELLQSGGQGTIFNNVVNFMLSPAGGGTPFTVQGVVPEPNTGLLVSGGLIGMAMKRRREAREKRAAVRS